MLDVYYSILLSPLTYSGKATVLTCEGRINGFALGLKSAVFVVLGVHEQVTSARKIDSI